VSLGFLRAIYVVSDDDKDSLPDYYKNGQLVEGYI
jgi:hypothetical protein